MTTYCTYYQGHGCVHFPDKGNSRNQTISGLTLERLQEYDSPIIDLEEVPWGRIADTTDIPMGEHVAYLLANGGKVI